MENTSEHFAKKLKEGDHFSATIRHKTDGSKNRINQKCTVVHNGELVDSLIAKTAQGEIVRIPYNEISEPKVVTRAVADMYQGFFNFMSQEHNLILTISEMNEILNKAFKLNEILKTE